MRVVSLLLLWLASVGTAQAADLQRVGQRAATSTCIGDASSPRCTVDTLMACLARATRGLCQRVGAELPDPMPEPRAVEYVVERESVIRADEITDDLRDVAWFRPGYTLMEIQVRSCANDAVDCDNESWEDLQVYLRLQGSQWRIVHWRAPGDPDAEPVVPEAFRPRAE